VAGSVVASAAAGSSALSSTLAGSLNEDKRKEEKVTGETRNTGATSSTFVACSGAGVDSAAGAVVSAGVDSTTGAGTASEADIIGKMRSELKRANSDEETKEEDKGDKPTFKRIYLKREREYCVLRRERTRWWMEGGMEG
jgi:hypothetical protein